jgi:hypothetical protein
MGTSYENLGILGLRFEPDECILEIGSERGDLSTGYLRDLAAKYNVPFYSVDFNRSIYDNIKNWREVNAYNMKGEDFLRDLFPSFKRYIRVAYLDNFDWRWRSDTSDEGHAKFTKKFYEPYGLVCNNTNSQLAHREQVELIVEFTRKESVVLIDDTWLSHDGMDGKGGMAVPFLLNHGFSLLNELVPKEEDHDGFVLLQRTS